MSELRKQIATLRATKRFNRLRIRSAEEARFALALVEKLDNTEYMNNVMTQRNQGLCPMTEWKIEIPGVYEALSVRRVIIMLKDVDYTSHLLVDTTDKRTTITVGIYSDAMKDTQVRNYQQPAYA